MIVLREVAHNLFFRNNFADVEKIIRHLFFQIWTIRDDFNAKICEAHNHVRGKRSLIKTESRF